MLCAIHPQLVFAGLSFARRLNRREKLQPSLAFERLPQKREPYLGLAVQYRQK
jgi:hypothetical protein